VSAELAPYALDPFGPSANPSAYVACEASERARAILERSLDEGRVAAVMGPPGYGKTLLLRLLGGREQERARVAYVPFCTLEVDELFAIVLNEIGVSRPGRPRDVLAAAVRELAPRGGVVILIDDANALSEICTLELAQLYEELGGALRIALAAVQGPAAQRVFRAFGSSIDVVLLAGGMSGREARRYVETRLAYGGARPELVAQFDDATIDALHRASQGVPRRLNQAAEDVVRRATRGSLPRLRELTQATHVAPAATAVAAPPPVPPEPVEDATLPARVDPPAAVRAPVPRIPSPPPPAAAAAPTPSEESEEDGRGILLPEIFDRVPGEPAGEYRIVRGTPVRATPARSPETVLVSTPARPAPQPAPAAIVRVRRELPTLEAPPRAPEPVRLPIRLVGVVGFLLGVAMSVIFMIGREPAPAPVYGPTPLPPAAPQPLEPMAPQVARPPAARIEPSAPARPEPRREAPAASARVAVSINATPWAVVRIDGREVGETPLAGIPLTPGRHTFEARMPDGTMRQQTLDVDAAHKAVVFR
jgi:general secretion pathway protein A